MQPQTFGIGEHIEGATVVLDLSGEIDLAAVPSIRRRVGQLVEAGIRSVIVDLTAVRFLDSAGIAVLIAGWRLLTEAGGTLNVRHARGHVAEALDITGVTRTLTSTSDSEGHL